MRIAPAPTLILTFTESVSLATWRDTGMLAREWALYRDLLPHYARILLVTHGHSADPAILAPLLPAADARKVHVVCNHDELPPAAYAATVPARVAALIPPDSPAIIKTNQMQGGELALAIAAHLRGHNHPAALIARGGYPWSLFIEVEKGVDSPQAHNARAREGALCAAADLVFATTQEMLDHLIARHALDPARTRLIPNYVDLTRDPTPIQQRDPATLLYAGQLVPRKRVDLLIEALSLLPAPLRSTRLHIIGDGPELPRLQRLSAALNTSTTFTPRIPHHDLLNRMHACTIYVQASALEGHPKTVIEAMTTGAPIVAAQAPGLEVIAHNTDGLLVAPTPRALAAAVEDLLTNARLRSRLGTAAAHTARRLYGLPTILQLELQAHRDALFQPAAA